MVSNENSKIVDIMFQPGETIRIEEFRLNLKECLLRYEFIILLKIIEKYEASDCENKNIDLPQHNTFFAISTNIIKQHKLVIRSRGITIPIDAHQIPLLEVNAEVLQKDYATGNFLIDKVKYSEKISLNFIVSVILPDSDNQKLKVQEDIFCYDLYFEEDKAFVDYSLTVDKVHTKLIKS